MTVGFYSPLPPVRTGVADYAAALLRGLRRLGPVEVNARKSDVALYQLGNNQLHGEIYSRALKDPGIVVLHDALLHHFFLGSLSETEYIAEFTYNYGKWSEDLARSLWRQRARSATDPLYFRYPMLKRIAESSLAVIVHNPAAAEMARAHAPNARILEVPHLFEPMAPPAVSEVERLRRQMGCDGQTLLCGVFGHLRESKRLLSVLRAFDLIKERVKIKLLVAGEFASSDLARAVAPLLSREGVVRRSYLSEADFWKHAAAVDVCANLRSPAAGETSGIGIRLMGIGKPVIVTDAAETSRYPEGTCLRVDAGESEAEMLAAYLEWLAADRQSRLEIGARAAAYIQKEHSLANVADSYMLALRACSDGISWVQRCAPPI